MKRPAWMRLALQSLRRRFNRPVRYPGVGLSALSMVATENPSASRPGAPAMPEALDPALRGLVREELSRLLDRVPTARRALPALCVVERALRMRDPDALAHLPAIAIEQATRQLRHLGRTGPGDLLRTLDDHLRAISGDASVGDDDDGEFELGRNVEVQDITLTQFMRVDC
jgi:hypothetical protein